MSSLGNKHDTHRDSWELIPWLANECLSASESRRIEAHVRECEHCREELAVQRRLRDAIRRSEAPVVLAPQASFHKLMARIDEDERPREQRTTARALLRTLKLPRTSRWLAIAACAQGILLAGVLGAGWWQARELGAPRFSTVTTPASTPRGPVIRIVFREDVTIAELNELLRSLDAHIVSGPTSAGVFTVQLASARRTDEQTETIAAQLRADPRVRFSEPAMAELAGK